MTYTIAILNDGKLIAEREASPDVIVAILSEMVRNNPGDDVAHPPKDGTKRRRKPPARQKETESEQVDKAARRHPATEQIEEMLVDGLTTAAIMERVEVSPPTIAVIRKRLESEGRI